MTRPHRLARLLVLAGAISYLGSCSAESRLSPHTAVSLREATTGEATRGLDAADHFMFSAPLSSGGPAEISEETAKQLARVWAVSLGPMVRSSLEDEHGGSIDFGSLAPCRRTLYARSPYLPPPPEVAATAGGAVFLRGFGSYWLVSLCNASNQISVTLAVSVYSTDLRIEGDQVIMPPVGGEWFHWRGVPAAQSSETMIGAERAAVLAYELSGKRVKAIPELIIPAKLEGAPYDARWHIALEGDTTFTVGPGPVKRSSHDLFLGWSVRREADEVALAALAQPSGLPIRYVTNLTVGKRDALTYAESFLVRDSLLPLAFEPLAAEVAK